MTRVAKQLDVPEEDIYTLVPHLRKTGPIVFRRSELSPHSICHSIDHTILKQNATAAEIRKLCEEAVKFGFAAVCVNGSRVAQARDVLQSQEVCFACLIV